MNDTELITNAEQCLDEYDGNADMWAMHIYSALDRLAELAAVVAWIDARHVQREFYRACRECSQHWPCPTHLRLHPDETT